MNKSCVRTGNKNFAREKLLYLMLNISTEEIGLRDLLLLLVSICNDGSYAMDLLCCSSTFTCSSSVNSISFSAAVRVLKLHT